MRCHVSVDWENCEGRVSNAHKITESQSQKRLSITEHTQRRPQRRLHIVTNMFSDSQKHEQSAVQDSIDSLIDVLYTQILTEDQIEDTGEHAHSDNLGCHSHTHFQWHSFF